MILFYVPYPNKEVAESVAEKIITKKLAACCQIFDCVSSFYIFKGKFSKDKEVVMILKTLEKSQKQLEEEIKKLHPYECPCILSQKIDGVNEEYLSFMKEAVR